MTAPEQAQQPTPAPRRTWPPGPEVIGTVLAVIVVVVIGTTAFAGPPASPTGSGSPRPTQSVAAATASPKPLVDPGTVKLLRAVNERLAGFAVGLQRELDRSTLRTNEVQALIRQVSNTVSLGSELLSGLGGALGENEPGGKMAALYKVMGDSAIKTLDASVQNDAEYRVGAGLLVKWIPELGPLQAELDALALGPPPTPVVSPSSALPSAPASSPPPSSAPAPSSQPPASVTPAPPVGSPPPSGGPIPPEPSPAPDEQVTNGGFEIGVGPPWALFVGLGGQASLAADTSAPSAGTTAAVVDITVGSPAYSGISLRQPGMRIEVGRHYLLTMWMRSEIAREIRVRITSTAGNSYVARTATVGPAWAPITFQIIAPGTDQNAVLAIDLGRSDVTTWLDSVSFRPTAGP
ncbi:MAG TPA: hypothetical protein VFP66_00650 [Candidatus Limnocylindrales bacterium]|nr:hypothetical protein [Candidatus Limnocylindrales bacterium]